MSETNNKKNFIYKVTIIGLIVIIAILAWQLIVTKNTVKTIIVEKTTSVNKSQELQKELDALMAEHNTIKSQYGKISEKLKIKDSIILANAKEIQKLIVQQGDYNSIKHKMEILRDAAKGYITQLDSLFRVNKVLKEENIKIKTDFKTEQQKSNDLQKEKEALTEKVTLASSLKAYNFSCKSYKLKSGGKKEVEIDKAKKTDKIKICYTIAENAVASNGNKSVFLRIAGPDNKILFKGAAESSTFVCKGETLQYSIKDDVDYQNKDLTRCVYWEKTDVLQPGLYNVTLFVDGYSIGETNFNLK